MKLVKAIPAIMVVLLIAVISSTSLAQVSGMAFSGSAGTYTPISGGTVLTTTNTWDDSPNYIVPIGFTFNFNGVNYDTLQLSMNGFVTFGSTAPGTSNYTPISSTTAYAGAISAFGRDLQGVTALGEIQYLTSGGVLTLQWSSARRYNGTTVNAEDFSFQIKLYQTSNKIEIVYGAFSDAISATSSSLPQVGLRGATSADFNNREVLSSGSWSSSTAGATNVATGYYNEVTPAVKPASGLTFTWQNLPQSYVSSTTSQNTAPVLAGAAGAQVIGVQIVMSGSVSPLSATSFTLNTNGTTTTADISNAKFYYTGTSPVFATATQIGSTVPAPSGSFSFTGSQVLSNGTNYFWLAYDVSPGAVTGHLIDGECTSLTVGSVYAPTVTAPAGARSVVAPLSGTKTVGSGGDYATLIDAAAAVNSIGLGGNLTLNIISDLADTAVVINQWSEAGAGGYRLTIKPSGAPRVIAGNSGTAVIKLNGADRVTIDGSTSGGSDRSLTITNARATSSTAVIQLASLGIALGATDNIIKNCNLIAGSNTLTTYGISVGSTIGVSGNDNDNLTIQNNAISKAYYGVYVAAPSTGVDNGLVITQNSIGSATATDYVLYKGVYVTGATNAQIMRNTIFNMITSTLTTNAGIELASLDTGTVVSRNLIHSVKNNNSSGWGAYGINIAATSVINAELSNNVIYDITTVNYSASSTTYNPFGIRITGGTGHKLYFNSVNLYGTQFASGSAGTLSAALLITLSTTTGMDIRNNLFMNSLVGAAGSSSYGVYAVTGTTFATINNNSYYGSGTYGKLGFLGADKLTIGDWQTATGQDAASLAFNPLITSDTDLQPQFGSPLLLAGAAGTGITVDYLGNSRGGSPTVGAYENAVGDIVGPQILYTALTSTGSTTNRTIVAVISDPSGVAGGGNAPRIYYRKGGSGVYVNANATTVVDSHYTFTINNASIGGVTPGDTVQYYLAAQDVMPNGSTNPSGGSGVTPPGTTAPAAPNSYTILVLVSSFPYTQDFEGAALGWTSGIFAGAVNDWVIGTPAKPHIAGAHSGTKAYTTTLTGSYSASENAYVQSPIFNLTSLSGSPVLEFWHNFYVEPGYEAGVLEVSSNGGATWSRIDSTLGTGGNFTTTNSFNWYNSISTSGPITPVKWSGYDTVYTGHTAGWMKSKTTLAGLGGLADVRLRWRFGSDGSVQYEGWAVDDITIRAGSVKDIQVSSVQMVPGTITVGAPVTVSAVIINNGSEANPASVPLTYKAGSAPGSSGDGVAQTFSPSWSGNTATVTFTTTYVPGSTGSLTMYVKSFYAGDEDSTNNTSSVATTVLPAGTLLYEPFESATFPPTGWKRQTFGSGNAWLRSTAAPHAGTGSAYYPYNSTYAADTWLISPGVALTGGTQYRLTYWYKVASATYPENMNVAMGTLDTASAMTTILADHPGIVNTSYVRSTITVTPGVSGTYYFGFHCYSAADMYNLYLDDVLLALPPAVDMGMASFYQSSGLPFPEPPPNTIVFAPLKKSEGKNAEGCMTLDAHARGYAATAGTPAPSSIIENQFDKLAFLPINVKGVGTNTGVNATTWTFNWNVEGVAQTPVSRPSVPSGSSDTAASSYTSSLPGTFYAVGKAVAAGDGDNSNDSLAARLRVYPDSYNRTIYDRSVDTVDTYIGWNSLVTQMKAGVRFTATATRKLAGVDFICRSEAVTGSGTWQVQVRSAGATDSVPGAVLYTRTYSGLAYNATDGDYVTFAFDASAPVISTGTKYWITIKGPAGILYPGGSHSRGFTSGHSFYELSPDTTLWSPLVLTAVEYAWIMRSYDVEATTTAITVPVANSWNLVSLPLSGPTPGNLVQQVYTTSATATAFKFTGTYVTTTTLDPGPGYWIKSTSAFSQSITGTAIDSLTIPLSISPSPWNIIGSISTAIDTSSARVTPSVAGLRGSSFFKYSAGYQATDSLKPGGGYWVKVNSVGSFHLHKTGTPAAPAKGTVAGRSIEDLNVLTIQDANGGLQKLYFGADGKNEIPVDMFAMPPQPPAGSFDARFVAEGGMMVQTHAEEVSDVIEMPIAIQSVAYPLTVSWKVNGSSTYELSDASGNHAVRGEGLMKINNSAVNHLTLKVTGGSTLPKEFALSQNYPNPFNPTTNIKYALPVDSKLTMEIYNILGQKVRTLLAGEQAAGYHSVEWNGKGNEGQQLASGVYFLQMSAAGANGKKFSELKKLMLMK